MEFQPTHPRGVRPNSHIKSNNRAKFQPTHPRGVRRVSRAGQLPGSSDFNPRTREGCDTVPGATVFAPSKFQPTHPRGVRPGVYPALSVSHSISTHAPARGATLVSLKSILRVKNFNPRTREGCDEIFTCSVRRSRNFNPRTREGCDYFAPTFVPHSEPFQPTHPRGVRPAWQRIAGVFSVFQPTHPRGVRPRWGLGCQCRSRNFNPRTREGCDFGEFKIYTTCEEFQPTHPRGVRPGRLSSLVAPAYFNPRTREGCDFSNLPSSAAVVSFQPTHPRGVRLGCRRRCPGGYHISTHAPARGATIELSRANA